jgi:hypothetical protein
MCHHISHPIFNLAPELVCWTCAQMAMRLNNTRVTQHQQHFWKNVLHKYPLDFPTSKLYDIASKFHIVALFVTVDW